jgi:hypothetical protein
VGSPSFDQSVHINDIMHSVMDKNHVSFEELKVKVFSMLRNVLIDVPEQFLTRRMSDEKATVILNGTANKEKFISPYNFIAHACECWSLPIHLNIRTGF